MGRGKGVAVGQQGDKGPTQAASGREGHFYVFSWEARGYDITVIIIGIAPVYHKATSILFDLKSIYAYVFAYFF